MCLHRHFWKQHISSKIGTHKSIINSNELFYYPLTFFAIPLARWLVVQLFTGTLCGSVPRDNMSVNVWSLGWFCQFSLLTLHSKLKKALFFASKRSL